jgi:hypothetical protein
MAPGSRRPRTRDDVPFRGTTTSAAFRPLRRERRRAVGGEARLSTRPRSPAEASRSRSRGRSRPDYRAPRIGAPEGPRVERTDVAARLAGTRRCVRSFLPPVPAMLSALGFPLLNVREPGSASRRFVRQTSTPAEPSLNTTVYIARSGRRTSVEKITSQSSFGMGSKSSVVRRCSTPTRTASEADPCGT